MERGTELLCHGKADAAQRRKNCACGGVAPRPDDVDGNLTWHEWWKDGARTRYRKIGDTRTIREHGESES